ncbi:hydroxyacid dehydrogenase [Allostreptomyces psammosilenae]|uniref:Phosphoglycerate dehydrogenase-like enzyme n=1 Tax=Allostreptomyces psammosilenae TaxID=1892865 RepID=A0A852ZNC1_9ACTN|nr:hydroxyacid dehydrogenase [Allostreptomyces psammosilenae]NYI03946.1 phosphoglycerate dehydrogenase-like enzyme [Allostreptomyces psammosilenae]
MTSDPSPRRPPTAVVLAPGLRDELFGRAESEELARTADLVAECPSGRALLTHPRRGEVEVLVTSWGAPRLTAEVLDELPALRTVLHAAGSVRKLVSDAVWERGLVVVSAADANNEPVAEFVYAHVVLALKDVHRRSRHIAETGALPPLEAVPGIYGQSVGLVSFGSTARKVARRLRRLDAEVLAWDPFQDDGAFRAEGVTRVAGLRELARASRVLSIHTPLIPGRTEKLVTGDLLRALPHGATLINTARGAVVDEEAMIEVLLERPDLFAVLDVTTEEPPAPGSPLYSLPNVTLTGHVAGTVGGERRAMGRLVVHELRRLALGLAPRHAVSAEAARLRA